MKEWVRARGALWLGAALIVWLHLPGWLHGQVYLAEDVAALFYNWKTRLYLLAQGQQPWSWWDPLPQLGAPRLANIQVGWLSPFSLFFALVPPEQAWRLYPLGISLVLLGVCYWALRQSELSRTGAAWAACLWTGCGSVQALIQDPCYIESLVAVCAALGFSLRWWDRRRPGDALGLLLSAGLHVVAGNPTAFFFDHLCLALLLPALAWQRRAGGRAFTSSSLLYLAGILLFSLPLVALRDYVSHGHRTLPGIFGPEFAESFRLTAEEMLRRLVAENLLLFPKIKEHCLTYPLLPDLSAALTVLALLSWRIRRLRPLLLVTGLLFLQTLGERGGLLWVLHRTLPASMLIRCPERFMVVTSLAWCWLAAFAWDDLRAHPRARLGSGLLAAWAWLFLALAQTPISWSLYTSPAVFQLPPMPPPSGGRVMVARRSRPRPPLIWESMPLMGGRGTLVIPETLFDQGYLRGLALSQLGAQGESQLGSIFQQSLSVPLLRPDTPLLRSWGLTWLLEGDGQSFRWRRLQPDPPRFWLGEALQVPARDWCSRAQGEAFQQAQVEDSLPVGPARGELVVEADSPDYQRVWVRGRGLLVGSDQWDPGWRVRIDGKPAVAVRANLALKAVWLDEGSHRVEWEYRIPWWPTFWAWHGLGWLLAVGGWLLRPERKSSV